MINKKFLSAFGVTLLAAAAIGPAVRAQSWDQSDNSNGIRHVLLVSVDGMHAVDFTNCAKGISTVNNGGTNTAQRLQRWARPASTM